MGQQRQAVTAAHLPTWRLRGNYAAVFLAGVAIHHHGTRARPQGNCELSELQPDEECYSPALISLELTLGTIEKASGRKLGLVTSLR